MAGLSPQCARTPAKRCAWILIYESMPPNQLLPPSSFANVSRKPIVRER
jgi:hypothetical protein